MNRLVAVCAITAVLLCACLEGAGGPGDAADQIVAAERAMARLFREKGLREAYLSNLAEEAVTFRSGPCLARPIHEKRPADLPVLFAWEPELVDASLAGDLGYTFGPYHVYASRTAIEPVGQGHYLAFWRRQADGTWKSVVDVGTAHGKVDLTVQIRRPVAVNDRRSTGHPVEDLEGEKAALLEIDRGFSVLVRSKGMVEAYMAFMAEDFHYCREGEYPAIGREAAAGALKTEPGSMEWRPQAAVVAVSGDLAYTYGTREDGSTPAGSGAQGRTSYLRIWNRGSGDRWVLFLELVVPYPPQGS